MKKTAVGVMGSSALSISSENLDRFTHIADALGATIVENNCVLITGETSGIPNLVLQAVHRCGGFSVGISPAHDLKEQREQHQVPAKSSNVVIFTGFGLKGRNVINIRSSDIVIIFSGSIGTLNEFTIAYDEGKIIGVITETGGIADEIKQLLEKLPKKTGSRVHYNMDPKILLEECLAALQQTI